MKYALISDDGNKLILIDMNNKAIVEYKRKSALMRNSEKAINRVIEQNYIIGFKELFKA